MPLSSLTSAREKLMAIILEIVALGYFVAAIYSGSWWFWLSGAIVYVLSMAIAPKASGRRPL